MTDFKASVNSMQYIPFRDKPRKIVWLDERAGPESTRYSKKQKARLFALNRASVKSY